MTSCQGAANTAPELALSSVGVSLEVPSAAPLEWILLKALQSRGHVGDRNALSLEGPELCLAAECPPASQTKEQLQNPQRTLGRTPLPTVPGGSLQLQPQHSAPSVLRVSGAVPEAGAVSSWVLRCCPAVPQWAPRGGSLVPPPWGLRYGPPLCPAWSRAVCTGD